MIQNYIDGEWASGQMFLVLCGSFISFMENEVLSEKNPVFGRRTAQIRLEPFSYMEAAEFVPSYSEADKAVCYGITGGIAKYLSLMDDSLNLDENIVNQFFIKSGYMYERADLRHVYGCAVSAVCKERLFGLGNGACGLRQGQAGQSAGYVSRLDSVLIDFLP